MIKDEAAVAAIDEARALVLEAEAAVHAAMLGDKDRQRVGVWLTLAQHNLRKAERARKDVWRHSALEDVKTFVDSVKHLIALRAVASP